MKTTLSVQTARLLNANRRDMLVITMREGGNAFDEHSAGNKNVTNEAVEQG